MNYNEGKKIAEQLIRQDNYPDALVKYLELFKENPQDKEVIEKMLFLFTRIQEGNLDFIPKTAEHFLMRGVAKFYNRDLLGSVTDYNMAIKLNPKYDMAYRSRADSMWLLSKTEEAFEDIEKAISLDPTGSYYDKLAQFYSESNDKTKALLYYKKAVDQSPEEFRLWYNYGVELMDAKRYKEALTMYNKAIELWPQYDDAHFNRKILLDNFPELNG